MTAADHVDVERIGGFAGFGLPGSRLRSRGRVALPGLTPDERQALERLFEQPPPPAGMPDAFRYRLTRQGAGGMQAVEVDESCVPETLRRCVRDELA